MKPSKKYVESAKLTESTELYSPKQALDIVLKMPKANYDQSIELVFNLGIDPKQADQQLRGTLMLPQGTGKKTKIVAICKDSDVESVKKAGASEAGNVDLLEKIEKGWFDFDLLITSPDMMGKLGKLGRLLGSKGLMPNIKSGTITKDLVKTVTEFSKGKITYRNDKYGNIHVIIGKESFSSENLMENFLAVYETIIKDKPSKSKGVYIKTIAISKTHSPSLKIETLKIKWSDQNG